jgi:hypothetical protein
MPTSGAESPRIIPGDARSRRGRQVSGASAHEKRPRRRAWAVIEGLGAALGSAGRQAGVSQLPCGSVVAGLQLR